MHRLFLRLAVHIYARNDMGEKGEKGAEEGRAGSVIEESIGKGERRQQGRID